jgi:hypothetical protein
MLRVRRTAARPCAAAMVGGLLLLLACGERADHRFSSPAATFRTYQQALRQGDRELLWACYSRSFQEHLSGGRQAWEAQWDARPAEAIQAELRREIVEEKQINGDIGYLLFADSTLPAPGESPFFYFVRQEDGWFLTSHLDALFHQRLEKAVAAGALKLGDR